MQSEAKYLGKIEDLLKRVTRRKEKPSKVLTTRQVKHNYDQLIKKVVDSVSDSTFGYQTLAQDIVFKKIPQKSRMDFIKYAMEVGSREARSTVKEFETNDPNIIAEKFEINIEHSSESNVSGSLVIYSEYIKHRGKKSAIKIYYNSMAQLNKFIKNQNLQRILGIQNVIDIYISHELFHHIEEVRLGSVGKQVKVFTLKKGPVKIDSGVASLSEIAANTFAETLLDLSFSPKILDYITLLMYDEQRGRNYLKLLSRG